MNNLKLEYMKTLKPAPHKDGRELLKEGIEFGKTVEVGQSKFDRTYGKTFLQYKKDLTKEGKIFWNILIGLANVDEQVQGIKDLWDFTQRTGMEVHMVQPIGSGVTGLPKELREQAPVTTSFVMNDFEDYQRQAEAAPFPVSWMDWVLTSPAAIETTLNSLKAGGPIVGVFCQIMWGYPGFTDEEQRFNDMVKCLGIMASKYDQDKIVLTYPDDGMAGYFTDCASYVGYSMLEHYICRKLCGARYMIAFGGLLSDGDIRMATAMALDKALSTEDEPILHYINGSTNLQWDHDIHGNYGVSVPEMLLAILVERKYHMGMGINPVSITEKIAVPTLQELEDILAAGKRAEEIAPTWEKFVDFTVLEEMRDVMVEQGKIFFENTLTACKEAGIDIEDPLEMILFLRKINPMKYEQMFHPSTFNTDSIQVKPFYPTILGKQTSDLTDVIIGELRAKGYQTPLAGKKVVVGSGDCHTYGLLLVEGVLSAMGAEVINAGVDVDPIDLVDLAKEVGTQYIGVSCHNGQSLDYARQLKQVSEGTDNKLFLGGVINTILPGDSVPTDVTDMIRELGVLATNELEETIQMIAQ